MEIFIYFIIAAIPGAGAALLASQWLTNKASLGLGLLVFFGVLVWMTCSTPKNKSAENDDPE